MSFIFNIRNIKINNMSHNASVIIGPGYHNSHTASSKSQGGNNSIGDQSPVSGLFNNQLYDPDINDQSEVANTDSVNGNQAF
ncbi:hypothetical protein JOD45_000842 [Scopulibacillus daqui]|uniref:Spore germination protein GerPA/GerPF n=1 Tax=Scopulibacillus daqui TaxID=1469162 RepID=A0ABS2PX70_9BACL|nr:spore germination protein [Scopulibacillus daqui]MBM7644649.1 hypothetical protein [Scopulibacillus daqui]